MVDRSDLMQREVTPENFPKFILEARQYLNLKQADFAEELGVYHNTIHRWERGHKIPTTLYLTVCAIKYILYLDKLKGESYE